MIERWLVRHREAALSRWDSDMQFALMLIGMTGWERAARDVRRSRARLRLWDLLLDTWTGER